MIYVCTGSCHGVATQAEYDSGAKVCGAESCERKGQPLVALEEKLRCQSCGMPLMGDASRHEYCEFCFKDGAFTEPEFTLEDMINKSVHYMSTNLGYTEENARKLSGGIIPHLKRWQNLA